MSCVSLVSPVKFLFHQLFLFQVHWVQCDGCQLWFHLFCIGLKPENVSEDEDFICKWCKPNRPKAGVNFSNMTYLYCGDPHTRLVRYSFGKIRWLSNVWYSSHDLIWLLNGHMVSRTYLNIGQKKSINDHFLSLFKCLFILLDHLVRFLNCPTSSNNCPNFFLIQD